MATKTYYRTLTTTSTHVETDIVDENGNYKHYTKLDEVPTEEKETPKSSTRPIGAIYVDTDNIEKIFDDDPYKEIRERLNKLAKKNLS